MIVHGDCLNVMAGMEADSVDSIVTDPPYGLAFMGKAWDKGVPGVPFWTEALRVAKPGSYLLAMGGTRTWHRLAVAIEDAGWEIRDCLSWLYGQGFPKGKACFKPAWEPIVMARKRGSMRHLRIDDCRLELNGERPYAYPNGSRGSGGSVPIRKRTENPVYGNPLGRWPANVCLDEEAAAMLDEQSGSLPAGVAVRHRGNGKTFGGESDKPPAPDMTYADSGGASRFFYVAKASRGEREAGLSDFKPKQRDDSRNADQPSMNGGAGNPHNRGVVAVANYHPTVKPIALMRWLCRLVTPTGGTVLDPFAGSGTTGCAAALEGLRFVGIEKEAEYVAIAEARIAHWSKQEMMF